MSQCWVYHPEHEAKIVDIAEGRVLKQNGWYDSPAKFPSLDTIPRGTSAKDSKKSGSKKLEVTDANSS